MQCERKQARLVFDAMFSCDIVLYRELDYVVLISNAHVV